MQYTLLFIRFSHPYLYPSYSPHFELQLAFTISETRCFLKFPFRGLLQLDPKHIMVSCFYWFSDFHYPCSFFSPFDHRYMHNRHRQYGSALISLILSLLPSCCPILLSLKGRNWCGYPLLSIRYVYVLPLSHIFVFLLNEPTMAVLFRPRQRKAHPFH